MWNHTPAVADYHDWVPAHSGEKRLFAGLNLLLFLILYGGTLQLNAHREVSGITTLHLVIIYPALFLGTMVMIWLSMLVLCSYRDDKYFHLIPRWGVCLASHAYQIGNSVAILQIIWISLAWVVAQGHSFWWNLPGAYFLGVWSLILSGMILGLVFFWDIMLTLYRCSACLCSCGAYLLKLRKPLPYTSSESSEYYPTLREYYHLPPEKETTSGQWNNMLYLDDDDGMDPLVTGI